MSTELFTELYNLNNYTPEAHQYILESVSLKMLTTPESNFVTETLSYNAKVKRALSPNAKEWITKILKKQPGLRYFFTYNKQCDLEILTKLKENNHAIIVKEIQNELDRMLED